MQEPLVPVDEPASGNISQAANELIDADQRTLVEARYRQMLKQLRLFGVWQIGLGLLSLLSLVDSTFWPFVGVDYCLSPAYTPS